MRSALARHWRLDPDVTFLNHGSYGACPALVLELQSELRARLESEPVRFMQRELPALLTDARRALATFVNADAEGLAFLPNVTHAVSTVLRSLSLSPGDELLTHDHAYPACRNALEVIAARAGARVVVAKIPFPLDDAQAITRALASAVTPRTRLALVDHVTSPSGLVFPVAAIARALDERGVDVLVDGAHAPGMLALDVNALDVAYYAGNCHKWLCAPKGVGFLFVREDRRDEIRPLAYGHGSSLVDARERFRAELDWTGTADPTAILCVPTAIEVMASLVEGGWPAIRAHNHALAVRARELLCEALGVSKPSPDDALGSLAAVPLPSGAGVNLGRPGAGIDPLQEWLWTQHVEAPVFVRPGDGGGRLLRVSAQLHNAIDEYGHLASLLRRAPAELL